MRSDPDHLNREAFIDSLWIAAFLIASLIGGLWIWDSYCHLAA